MPKYNYKAKEGTSNVVAGVIEAATDAEAIGKVLRLGYTPISVSLDDAQTETALKTSVKATLADVTMFSRQLSALLDSGLNLLRALNTIKTQTPNQKFSVIVEDIASYVKEGHPLSESLGRYPRVFTGVYVAMVRVGEQGGMLSKILNQVTGVLEKEEEMRSRVGAALVYPVLLLGVGSLSVFVLLSFVIPRIVKIFTEMGQTLPVPTEILITISNFFASYWYLVLLVIGIAYFALDRYQKTVEGRLTIDRIKLKAGIIGTFISQVECANFTRTLGSLLTNGVPIVQGLKSAATTTDNEVLKKELEEINQQVTKGSSLTKALTASSYFPVFVINMVSIGEEGGSLDKVLLRIADIYDKEIDKTIKIITSLIEPILILFFGLIVGFIVVAMLLPILQISAAVG